MRRVTGSEAQGDLDERELQFDVRALETGDPVDVFLESERRWQRASLRISSGGQALVEIRARGATIPFEDALAMGLRRVLH